MSKKSNTSYDRGTVIVPPSPTPEERAGGAPEELGPRQVKALKRVGLGVIERATRRAERDAADPARVARRAAKADRKRGPDRTSVARSKVDGLEPQGKKGCVKLPFTYVEHPPFKLTKESFRGCQHGKVDLASLIATEPVVRRKVVKKDIETRGAFGSYPTVLRLGGQHYIVDGHHRATADWALGKETMRCNILHADDGE